jgi:hypothetical protein
MRLLFSLVIVLLTFFGSGSACPAKKKINNESKPAPTSVPTEPTKAINDAVERGVMDQNKKQGLIETIRTHINYGKQFGVWSGVLTGNQTLRNRIIYSIVSSHTKTPIENDDALVVAVKNIVDDELPLLWNKEYIDAPAFIYNFINNNFNDNITIKNKNSTLLAVIKFLDFITGKDADFITGKDAGKYLLVLTVNWINLNKSNNLFKAPLLTLLKNIVEVIKLGDTLMSKSESGVPDIYDTIRNYHSSNNARKNTLLAMAQASMSFDHFLERLFFIQDAVGYLFPEDQDRDFAKNIEREISEIKPLLVKRFELDSGLISQELYDFIANQPSNDINTQKKNSILLKINDYLDNEKTNGFIKQNVSDFINKEITTIKINGFKEQVIDLIIKGVNNKEQQKEYVYPIKSKMQPKTWSSEKDPLYNKVNYDFWITVNLDKAHNDPGYNDMCNKIKRIYGNKKANAVLELHPDKLSTISNKNPADFTEDDKYYNYLLHSRFTVMINCFEGK